MFRISTLTRSSAPPGSTPPGNTLARQPGSPGPHDPRPHDERPLNRNPGAGAGFALKLRSRIAPHVKVRDRHGNMVKPVIVTESELNKLIERWKSPEGKGGFVEGIPGAHPRYEARSLTLLDLKTGKCVTAGSRDENGQLLKFSQQSMSKPVAEALAVSLLGRDASISNPVKAYEKMVGFDPSGRPYNDPATYPDRPGVPFNSSVNIGALKTWDIIITHAKKLNADPFGLYLDFQRQLAGNPALDFNDAMAKGEFELRPAPGQESNNMRLLAKLRAEGTLENPREEVYLAYCRACAIMVDTEDVARVRASLRTGKYAGRGDSFMSAERAELLNRSTAMHGMYDESGSIFVNTGASIKSGVDGGLMGSLPSKIEGNPDIIFASHHAALNPRGNSLEGVRWVRELAKMPLIFADDKQLTKPSAIGKGVIRKVRAMTQGASPDVQRSPAAMDAELRAAMGEDGVRRLEAALASHLGSGYKHGFYLKKARGEKSLEGASLLFGELDRNGIGKEYYHVPDKHRIEKIVVKEDYIFPSQ